MAAKEMAARLEGEVAALRNMAELPTRPTPMDKLCADWDI
jgi:hypothetical protein